MPKGRRTEARKNFGIKKTVIRSVLKVAEDNRSEVKH